MGVRDVSQPRTFRPRHTGVEVLYPGTGFWVLPYNGTDTKHRLYLSVLYGVGGLMCDVVSTHAREQNTFYTTKITISSSSFTISCASNDVGHFAIQYLRYLSRTLGGKSVVACRRTVSLSPGSLCSPHTVHTVRSPPPHADRTAETSQLQFTRKHIGLTSVPSRFRLCAPFRFVLGEPDPVWL